MARTKGISGRGAAVRPRSLPFGRQCSVKLAYSSNAKSWRAHGHYLQRDGAQHEHGKGLCFGQQREPGGEYVFRDELDGADALSAWASAGDKNLFKLFVSPSQGEEVDLRELCRLLVPKLEADLGTSLEWFAIEHYNTDNPHVHLCLRGRDEEGKDLVISPRYIQEGARARAVEVVTTQLGYRSEADIQASRAQDVSAVRWTSLDAELVGMKDERSVVDLSKAPSAKDGRDAALEHLQMLRRLRNLEVWGLAQKEARGKWKLQQYAQRALFEYTRAKDRTKKVLAGEAFVTDSRAPLQAQALEGGWAAGRVLGSGKDRTSGQPFVLLEGLDGKVHYVTGVQPEGWLRPGSTVWVERSPAKVEIQELSEHGPEVVRRFLERNAGAIPPLTSKDDSYADRFARAAYVYSQELRREQGLEPLAEFERLKREALLSKEQGQGARGLESLF